MKILIFGYSGFIGLNLVKLLQSRSHDLVLFGRVPPPDEIEATYFPWSLEMAITETVFEATQGADVAVHLAHDFRGLAGARCTISGVSRLLRNLERFGLTRNVFVSSYSAGEHATSTYGRTKHILEKRFLSSPKNVVVRPGLVLGNGGIFGRISTWASKAPLLLLPDGGRAMMPIITVGQLCDRIATIIENPQIGSSVYNLFFRDFVSLRHLVLASVQSSKKIRPVIVPIPSFLLLCALELAEWFHIPLPVTSDNLRGLISNKNAGHQGSLEGTFDFRDV